MSSRLKAKSARTSRARSRLTCWGALSALSISLSSSVFAILGANAAFSQQSGTLNNRTMTPPTEGLNRPTLSPGSRGTDVTELQATLKLLGYYGGSVDGVYGQSTITAVSQFQQFAGLSTDGIVGPATWSRLFPPTPDLPSTVSPTTNPAPVAEAPTRTNSGFPVPSSASSEPTSRPTVVPRPASPTPAATPVPTTSPVKKPASAAPTQPTPSSTDPVTLPSLRLGARGPAVAALQGRLRAIGVFKGAADGVFGSETQAAVKAAQQKLGLSSDGVVGSSTWTALLR